MNANQYFEFICKKKSAKKSHKKQADFHRTIGSLIIEQTEYNISQGTSETKERVLPMSIFLQPIL